MPRKSASPPSHPPYADLTRLVNPRNIAVVGASARPSSQGRRLYDNLALHSTVPGKIYPVNPAYQDIAGQRCWPTISALPTGTIDVALVMVNAAHVLEVLTQCAQRRIPFAIVMTSGFSETGEAGQHLEQQIAALCLETGLRVYGPNCPGFVNVRDRIGMTFSPAFKDDLNSGSIGLATQGGGLGRNLLQGLAFGEGVGLWFSAGNEIDLGMPDFIAHMARDPKIHVIALLMEGIKDGHRFTTALDLARRHDKPIVILKLGHSEAGVQAAQSHTASVAGSAAVNSAVFRQFGAIEVGDLNQLLAISRLLTRATPKSRNGLCVLSFSGGTAALAADLAGAANLPMANLTPATRAALSQILPAFASTANPVDTTADVLRQPQTLTECLHILCNAPEVGTILFPIPMDYGDITDAMAKALTAVAAHTDTLLVPVWMSRRFSAGFQHMETAGLLPFLSLSDAVAALRCAIDWRRPLPQQAAAPVSKNTLAIPEAVHTLSEVAAKAVLGHAGIAIPEGRVVHSADDAARYATELGFPIAMKIVSAQLTHKTDVGGVKLNIHSADAARVAYTTLRTTVSRQAPQARIDGILVERMLPPTAHEVLIGVHRDATFGLVMTFGLGGIWVEMLRDVAHRLLPLSPEEAQTLPRDLKQVAILDGLRGQPPADFAALHALLLQVSDFAWQHRDTLIELELNPVWLGSAGLGAIALDALIRFQAEPQQAS